MKKAIISIVIIVIALAIVLNFDYLTQKLILDYNYNPGEAAEDTYPVIILHGFNPFYSKRITELEFKGMQEKLANDLNYSNRGIFLMEKPCSSYAYKKNPVIVRASYFEPFEPLTVDEYSKKLDLIISRMIECTGAKKVDVVAHSLGGIVARNYLKKSEKNNIRKLIMFGTPNHGGVYNVDRFIGYFEEIKGAKLFSDLLQIFTQTEFINELNNGGETPGSAEYFTIAGRIDEKGDGVVEADSVKLNGAENEVVKCDHFLMKHPEVCPQAYGLIKEWLE